MKRDSSIVALSPGSIGERARDAYEDLRFWVAPQQWSSVLAPTAFFIAAVTLLTYNHTSGGLEEKEAIFWAALLLVVIVFAWMLVRVGNESRAALAQHMASYRDELTGLRSAAALELDLAEAFRSGVTTVLFLVEPEARDVGSDGPEREHRDQIVVNVGTEVSEAGESLSASIYRIEGARFAILAPAVDVDPSDVTARARAALTGGRYGALANAHFGEVVVPLDADRPDQAIQLADERLAASKRHGFRSARRQVHAALLATLSARDPQLRDHLRSVVPRVISLGRRLNLDRLELDDVVLAAGLQDIGLLGVPASVLVKKDLLTVEERSMLRSHPVTGQRIIASAPALSSVANIVRSAYERYDGTGYPDGLKGDAIPLGARVIAPCVALAAMTAERPYSEPLSTEAAAAELIAGSGTQFDPRVVSILVEDLTVSRPPRS